MVEEPSSRCQHRGQGPEIRGHLGRADVFEHADRRDGVVALDRRRGPDVPVVLEPDLDPVGQAGLGHPLAGQRVLLFGDGDPDGGYLVVGSGVHDHATPAAADVEQAHPRLQAELAADEVVLGGLGHLEGVGRVGEHGARVGHGFAEQQAVELVADVVVMGDGGRVPPLAVPASPQPGFLGRPGQRTSDHAQADPGPEGVGQGADADAELVGSGLDDRPQRPQGVAFDVGLTEYEGPGEADLVRAVQDAAHRVRRVQDDAGRCPERAEAAPVPKSDLDGQVVAEHGGHQGGEGDRGAAGVGLFGAALRRGPGRCERAGRHESSLAR